MNTPGKASLPVIKRLPKYYRYLRTLKTDGITSISSRELAAQMGTTASQVRQDFNCLGDVNGRQGIGYSVENLLNILEHLLFGNGDLLPTILIGCGRLGKAVSRFITTDTNGYKLIAAFDNSPEEVGKEINGIQILHVDQLEDFCAEHKPEVAVLCVPRSGAEELSGRLVGMGMAKQLVYSALNIKADEALRIGLVNAVYPQAELMENVLKLAGKIAKNAPIAVRNCKKAINDGISLPIEKAVEVEEKLFGGCFETHDQNESMACFLSREKPKPKAVFTNN